MTAWRSGGRSVAFDGRVDRDVVRTWVVCRVVRVEVSVWRCISMQN